MTVSVITSDMAPLFVDRLFSAAMNGNQEEIRALVQAGMDINTHHPIHTRTILMEATRTNQPELVSFLLQEGATVNLPELQHNAFPLHFAVDAFALESLEILLAEGANIRACTNRGKGVFHLLTQREYSTQKSAECLRIIDALTEAGGDYDQLDDDDTSPLHYCALYDNRLVAQRLLKAGANPNIQTDGHGVTPLHIAILEKRYAFADLMHAYGADASLRNRAGKAAHELQSSKRNQYKPPVCETAQDIQDILNRILPEGTQPA